jgi:serine/threonine protein phosphatase PrpC
MAAAESIRTKHWNLHAASIQGGRPYMEDSHVILPAAPAAWRRADAVAVFDGVGGMPRGSQASAAARKGLEEAIRGAVSPADILDRLNLDVKATGGATTAVAAILGHDGVCDLVWCGDSNAHDARGRLTQPDQEDGFLTRALGLRDAKPHARRIEVARGQAILLCSDGVDGPVGAGELQRALAGPDDEAGLRSLMHAVEAAGAPDNATAVLARRL